MNASRRRVDLAATWGSSLRIWGPPVLVILAGSTLRNVPGLPAVVSGLLWSTGICWSGVSCLLNALRCGRFHCSVLAVAHPLLALLAAAVTFHLVPLAWNTFWLIAFLPVTVASFIPEFFGVMYVCSGRKGA